MRYLVIFLLLITAYADEVNKNKMYEIVDEYRKDGLKNIKSILEKYLIDRDYWLNVLNTKDTKFGYYENLKYIFIASKSDTKLQLYKLENNKFNLINQTNAIFGSNQNDKKVEGDLATPIGVYTLTAKLSKLDQYYGPLAFATSYPNLYDKLHKKTGYGIWIHGLPLNGDRTEKNTKGCIAIENNTLSQYEKIIDYKDTILITSTNPLKEVSKDTLANILQGLFIWRNAWIENDLEMYLSFYDNDFIRFDGMKIKEFVDYKKRVFSKNETKSIDFVWINIAPYPNDKNQNMYKVIFLEDYKAEGGYKFKGVKELYITLNNNKMKILVEK
ncbi:MAG: L,D-transpeptidase family protein [Helicobacteraceae bacterium]|nr:L,D-transpeptidase family protein [Helicobacteraceae bacterium]